MSTDLRHQLVFSTCSTSTVAIIVGRGVKPPCNYCSYLAAKSVIRSDTEEPCAIINCGKTVFLAPLNTPYMHLGTLPSDNMSVFTDIAGYI